ncbi:MAG: hypothetical protein KGZ50_06345 [Peptococcaceae bacterium]|nr:hypothetical protein [Peptococcaceae bacterium]
MFHFVPVPEPCAKEQARLIEQAAQKIHQYGLLAPAIFFGEAMKPVSFMAGQAIHAFSFLPSTYVLSDEVWQQIAFILDDRSKIETFLLRLEELAKERL